MTISFAGSRCVDERRRRRLAQEAEGDALRERPAPSRRRAAASPDQAPEASEPKATAPIQSLVSRHTWVNLGVVALALIACGSVLYAGYCVDQSNSPLAATLGLESGLLIRLFRTVCLLLAGQLAYVIFWHRARSRKDFGGRYKVWMWVTPIWFVFAVCSGCDLHHLAIHAVPSEWQSAVYDPGTLAWMIPAGIFVLGFTRLLHVEMRECRTSLVFLWTSTAMAAAAAALTLADGILVAGPLWRLAKHVAASVWAVCLVSSMLLYARRVVYVSNEPCRLSQPKRRRPSLWSVGAEWWRSRRAARAEAKAKPEDSKAETPPARGPAEPELSSHAPAPEAKKSAPESRPVPPQAVQPSPIVEPEPKRPAPPNEPVRSNTPPQHDADSEMPETPRLSKKERRRLRKAQREHDRLAKAG